MKPVLTQKLFQVNIYLLETPVSCFGEENCEESFVGLQSGQKSKRAGDEAQLYVFNCIAVLR